jgi:hypothetical protein
METLGAKAMTTPQPQEPAPFPIEPVPPLLLAWASQTFDKQEYRAGVQEIRTSGGHSLESVIADVEALVKGS